MGLIEVGAYLEELRQVRRLTRQDVAPAIGISVDSLEFAEKGRGRLNGAGLLRLIHLLDGSYHELTRLLDDEAATVEGARSLARAWAARPAALGDRALTPEEETAELWEIALRRTGGDATAARRMLLRALDAGLD